MDHRLNYLAEGAQLGPIGVSRGAENRNPVWIEIPRRVRFALFRRGSSGPHYRAAHYSARSIGTGKLKGAG